MTASAAAFSTTPRPATSTLVESALAAATSNGREFRLVGPTPQFSSLKFAAFLYAGVSVIKPPATNTALLKGHVLITLTDQFFKLDVNTTMYAQDGPGGAVGSNLLAADMYLTILWGAGSSGVEGGVKLAAQFGTPSDPKLALDATAGLNFFASQNGDNPIWGIDGYLDADVLSLLTADGTFMAGPDGMLIDLTVEVSGDLAVVSAEAGMELLVWNLPNGTNPFGAYANLYIGFDVLGGLASLRADAKGLFLERPDVYEVYLAGSAKVKVLWVFDGTIAGWVKGNSRGNVDWGTGRNPDMDAAIQQARTDASGAQAKAEAAKQKMDAAKAALAAAQAALAAELADPANYRVSAADLRLAGAHLFLNDRDIWDAPQSVNRSLILDDVRREERNLFGASITLDDPLSYQGWLFANVLKGSTTDQIAGYYGQRSAASPFSGNAHAGSQPGIPVSQGRSDALAQEVRAVSEQAAEVGRRLTAAQPVLTSLANQLRDATDSGDPAAFNVRNPVSKISPARVGGDGQVLEGPRFVLSADTLAQGAALLENFDSDMAALDQSYRSALNAAAASAKLVDLVLDGASAVNWGAGLPDLSSVERTGTPVNAVGFGFVEATLAVDFYFTHAVNQLWSLRDWARTREALIPAPAASGGNAFQSAMRNATHWKDSWTSNGLSASQASKISRTGAERLRAIWKFNGNTNEGTTRAANFIASVTTLRTTPSLGPSVKATFNQTADQFWLEMPKLGLGEVVDATQEAAQALVTAYDAQRPALTTAHAAFTTTVDEMYGIKAGMLVSTYGMIEQYEAWRTDAGLPSQGTIRDARVAVAEALAPPNIALLRLKEGDILGISRGAEVLWAVSHPDGVPELSYAFRAGGPSAASVYDDVPYLTSGTASSSGLWFDGANIDTQVFPILRRSESAVSSLATLYVRGRSPGGVTATRYVQATVPLAEGGTSTIGEAGSLNGRNSDPTAPEAPLISLPNTELGVGTRWVPDSSRLDLVLHARDPQSGIARWEVALGSTRGASDVRSWQVFQGDRSATAQPVGWGSWGGGESISGTLFGLDLGLTPVYLSVRAVNGDGDVSVVRQQVTGLTHDATPPVITITVAPEARPVIPPAGPAVEHPALTGSARGEWDVAQRVERDVSAIGTATTDVTWSATDPESGIAHYDVGWVAASGAARFDSTNQGWGWNQQSQFSSRTAAFPFPFDTPYRVIARAQNRAGELSGVTATEPIQRFDPTRPTTPIVSVWQHPSGPLLTLARLSQDNQSGIRGYQIAVGTAPGADDLRPWRADSLAVDWDVPSNAATQYFVQRLAWNYATSGDQWISVRAVNGQGVHSRASTSRVFHDPTPPIVSASGVEFRRNGNQLIAEVNTEPPRDPESGLASATVEVRVPPAKTGPFSPPRNLSSTTTLFEMPLANGRATMRLTPAQVALLPAEGVEIAVTVYAQNTSGRAQKQTSWVDYVIEQTPQEVYEACLLASEADGIDADTSVRNCVAAARLPKTRDEEFRALLQAERQRRARTTPDPKILECLDQSLGLDPVDAVISCRQRLRLPALNDRGLKAAAEAEQRRRENL